MSNYPRTDQIMRLVAESRVEGITDRGFDLSDGARVGIEQMEDELRELKAEIAGGAHDSANYPDSARVERMRHFIEAVAKGIYGDEPTLQKDASDVLAGSASNVGCPATGADWDRLDATTGLPKPGDVPDPRDYWAQHVPLYAPPSHEAVQRVIDAARASGMPMTALRWAIHRLGKGETK